MLKPLDGAPWACALPELGAIRVQGAEALKFLQGQLSNDTERLATEKSQLAGLHTAQGRVIALLRLVMAGPDEVIGILPRELAPAVAARLAKYVLRAKARVTDASADWAFAGRTEAAGSGDFPIVVPLAAGRSLVGSPAAGAAAGRNVNLDAPAKDAAGVSHAELREHWRALDIAAGIPQVYAATSEAFVAQMLNLDVLGAISFEKGCYTGQEIIARAHYRGRVKRRMQLFRTRRSAAVAAGDTVTLSDGRGARVVDAVALGDGRSEFLAVTNLGASAEESGESASETLAQTAIDVESLPLPYALPD